MRRILVALALVILIVSSISILSVPPAKADTSDVRVLSYSWYVAPANTPTQAQYAGDLVVVGEIQNMGTQTLGRLVVGGEAYNVTGGFVGSAQFPPYVNYLGPGQKAPFYLDFAPDINDITYDPNVVATVTNVTVRVLNAVDLSQTQYTGLVIPTGAVSSSNATGTYTLTGTVQNTGDQATGRVWIVSTFYNASGTVVAMNYTNYISQSLLPSRSATFSATPIDNTAQLSSSIANYSILIQAEPAPAATPTPTAPLTTPTVQPSGSPTSSSQPTSPAPIEISTTLIIYLAAIAVIIVLVIFIALMLLRRRQRKAEFDLPPPPPPT